MTTEERGKHMEKVTVWTNDFSWGSANGYRSEAVDEVDEALADGKAVRVGADCIGHTRAAAIEYQSRKYFESVGAEAVETDWRGTYYALA